MTVDELQILLAQQNGIIDSLPSPPQDHIRLYPKGPTRQRYLEYFRRQMTFDAVRSWLRYISEANVRDWAKVLSPLVQPLVQRAEIHLSPDRRALGKGYLLTAS
jgi:hypothetical protein